MCIKGHITSFLMRQVLNVYERASKWHLALQLPEEIKAVAMGPDEAWLKAVVAVCSGKTCNALDSTFCPARVS